MKQYKKYVIPYKSAFILGPVSYTHLDVYKRQDGGWTCDGT